MLINIDPDIVPWYAKNIPDFFKKQDRHRLLAWREEINSDLDRISKLNKA